MKERPGRLVPAVTVTVGFVVCGAFAALAAQVYDAITEADGVAVLDQPALDAALAVRSPGLTRLVGWFTDLGGPVAMTLIVALAAIALTVAQRSAEPVVVVAVTAGGSLAMTVIGKAAAGRARPPFVDAVPPFESSFSFPSGHALNSMALAGILAYLAAERLIRWWARTAAVLLALLFAVAMGLSRVYLGHHWFTDVLGAWALALAWLAVVITAHRLYVRSARARRRPAAGGRRPGAGRSPRD